MTSTTMTATDELIAREEAWGAHNYHPIDLVIDHAEGAWVTDVEGKRYLDCLSAYAAVNQGHCHPRILATLVEQASRVTLTSRAFRNDQLGARRISARALGVVHGESRLAHNRRNPVGAWSYRHHARLRS